MTAHPKISILLPTFNERDNILRLIDALKTNLEEISHEIIVIDDNSPDQTWKIVAERAQTDPSVRLIHRIRERGLTSAYNRGIDEARGEILAWMDCDFSHPPEKISEMVALLNEQTQAVVASRYVTGAEDNRGSFFSLPVFLSWLLRWITGFYLRIHVRDTTSGYIVIYRTALDTIGALRGDYGEYFIDLVYRLIHHGYGVLEIPYQSVPREFGESKTATNIWGYARRGIKYLWTIVKLKTEKI